MNADGAGLPSSNRGAGCQAYLQRELKTPSGTSLGGSALQGSDDPSVEAGTDAPVPVGQHGWLDLRSDLIGWLHHWERAGHWFGVVDYSVPFVGDFRPCKRVDCGLVPAAAPRPRELPAPEGRLRRAP